MSDRERSEYFLEKLIAVPSISGDEAAGGLKTIVTWTLTPLEEEGCDVSSAGALGAALAWDRRSPRLFHRPHDRQASGGNGAATAYLRSEIQTAARSDANALPVDPRSISTPPPSRER